jgi:hypothetical protein
VQYVGQGLANLTLLEKPSADCRNALIVGESAHSLRCTSRVVENTQQTTCQTIATSGLWTPTETQGVGLESMSYSLMQEHGCRRRTENRHWRRATRRQRFPGLKAVRQCLDDSLHL